MDFFFFLPLDLLLRMKVRLLLGLLCAIENYSAGSVPRVPNFEIHLAGVIAARGDLQERRDFPFATSQRNERLHL